MSEKEKQRSEAAAARARARREQAIAKATRALAAAEREHDEIITAIARDRAEVEQRTEAEEARWTELKARLEGALRNAERSE